MFYSISKKVPFFLLMKMNSWSTLEKQKNCITYCKSCYITLVANVSSACSSLSCPGIVFCECSLQDKKSERTLYKHVCKIKEWCWCEAVWSLFHCEVKVKEICFPIMNFLQWIWTTRWRGLVTSIMSQWWWSTVLMFNKNSHTQTLLVCYKNKI